MIIRGLEIKNRVILAPISPRLATEKGYITTDYIDYFRPFARGGAAVLTLGNCSVDDERGREAPRQVSLADDGCLLGLARFEDMCRRYGAIACPQLGHPGIDADWEIGRVRPIGPSALITPREKTRAVARGREPVRAEEMTVDQIQDVEQMFVEAAWRCKRAGMRMILLQGGHGNLIAQFASPLYNHRKDMYGGSLENRARFALNVLRGIREKCGEDFVINLLVSADEMHPQGMRFEETKEFLRMLEDHVDIVTVSCGLHTDIRYYRYWLPNMYMPRMVNVRYAGELKKILKCKVAAVGGIANLDEAERVLSEGLADFCAMTRPLMADPEMPRKYAKNCPEKRIPCARCGSCVDRISVAKPLICAVNPRLGREGELEDGLVRPARVKKTVAVVGGGPAGMQAVLTLLERGHRPVLFEKEKTLGGNLAAAASPLRPDMREYCEHLCQAVLQSGADIRLGVKASPRLIGELKPDALIIAVGAEPLRPDVLGIDLPHVHWAAKAASGKAELGREIAIIGGGTLGLESAYAQSQEGRKVRLFEIRSALGGTMDKNELMPALEKNGVEIYTSRRLLAVYPDHIVCEELATGALEEHPCDTVLIAAGLKSRKRDVEALRHLLPETEVYIVGDAKAPRSLGDAVHEGFSAAVSV